MYVQRSKKRKPACRKKWEMKKLRKMSSGETMGLQEKEIRKRSDFLVRIGYTSWFSFLWDSFMFSTNPLFIWNGLRGLVLQVTREFLCKHGIYIIEQMGKEEAQKRGEIKWKFSWPQAWPSADRERQMWGSEMKEVLFAGIFVFVCFFFFFFFYWIIVDIQH